MDGEGVLKELSLLAEALDLQETSVKGEGSPEIGWDYSTVLSEAECGTVGCAIGLYAVLTSGNRFQFPEDRWTRALETESIHRTEVMFTLDQIFYGEGTRLRFEDVTPGMVAASIRHFIETGEAIPYGME